MAVEIIDDKESKLTLIGKLAATFHCIDDFPSPLLVYQASMLIYEITNYKHSIDQRDQTKSNSKLKHSFHSMMAAISDDHLSNVVLKDINSAFVSLTQKASATLQQMTTIGGHKAEQKDRLEEELSKCFAALKAFHTIYGDDDKDLKESAQRCSKLGFDSLVCNQIVFLYDASCQCQAPPTLKECILSILSVWMIHGLIESSLSMHGNEDDAIQSVMQVCQSISSEQSSTCLGDLVVWQKRDSQSVTLEHAIDQTFTNDVHAQKEYVRLVISSAKSSVKAKPKQKTGKKYKPKEPPKTQVSGIKRLVDEVKQVFPHYGDGYIEAALACYNHNLEKTTAALLEVETDPRSTSIHPRLRALDKNLPSRRKESKSHYDTPSNGVEDSNEDIEARELQKAHLREMEVEQENEAFLVSAAMGDYNDDYDDQYDGIGDDGGAAGGIGAADGGLYDVVDDFEGIKAFNKVTKEMEKDRLYWENSKNTNRRKSKKANHKPITDANDNDDDAEKDTSEKKYRGFDKGKKGRLIDPSTGRYMPLQKARKKGGAKSEPQGQKGGAATSDDGKKKGDNSEMTKIQKRRKNDNKAKVANHHRKE
eukprot:CAMPEP_0194094010 /NCGR_PEP_ID=MMETSP0149-20130528/52377_1 /TAXON_ID=122233 /ORGANISM="Chaetoceros debilis, Strain MM31A-1" /LENGTH=590 /DNA_ID=CAMNT_0038779507 /DNA_START=56 /DNA_END=1825 /DNA_ORIENTATION=-